MSDSEAHLTSDGESWSSSDDDEQSREPQMAEAVTPQKSLDSKLPGEPLSHPHTAPSYPATRSLLSNANVPPPESKITYSAEMNYPGQDAYAARNDFPLENKNSASTSFHVASENEGQNANNQVMESSEPCLESQSEGMLANATTTGSTPGTSSVHCGNSRNATNRKRKISGDPQDSRDDSGDQRQPGNSRKRGPPISPEEAQVYLDTIMYLLEKESRADVLQRIRKDNWNWLHKDENLMNLIVLRGKTKIPSGRSGASMKSYFKTHLGQGDGVGEIQRLFNSKVAPNFKPKQNEKFFKLIQDFKAVAPGTPNKKNESFAAPSSPNTSTPTSVRQRISTEETMCLIKGIRDALFAGVSVKDLIKVLNGDKWEMLINSTGKSLLDTIRKRYDKDSTRPAASYRSKFRSLLKNPVDLLKLAESAFTAEKYNDLTWPLFMELIGSCVKEEVGGASFPDVL